MTTRPVHFGWLSPVAGHAGSDFQPIVMYQEEHILPHALPHFDSVWIADHFYGFDADKTEGSSRAGRRSRGSLPSTRT
jgi:hypothetical protein